MDANTHPRLRLVGWSVLGSAMHATARCGLDSGEPPLLTCKEEIGYETIAGLDKTERRQWDRVAPPVGSETDGTVHWVFGGRSCAACVCSVHIHTVQDWFSACSFIG